MVFRLVDTGSSDYLPLDASELQTIIVYLIRNRRRPVLGVKMLAFIAHAMDMSGERYVEEVMEMKRLDPGVLERIRQEDMHDGFG